MRKAILVLLLTTASWTAVAADRVIILSEEETKVLLNMLDAAVKAQGLTIAANAAYMLDKINKASTLIEQKLVPEPDKPKEPPQ